MSRYVIIMDLVALSIGIILLWLSVGLPACLGFALLAVFARGNSE